MSLHVYRFRREQPLASITITSLVGAGVTFVASAAGVVLDLQADDTQADDLVEACARDGLVYLSTDPTTVPAEDVLGNGIRGTLTPPRVPHAASARELEDTAGFEFDPPTGRLAIPGNVTTGNGTVLLPAHSFVADPDTGFYQVAADVLGLANGGVLSHEFRATGYRTVDGTVTVPALSFLSDTNTGIWRSASDTINLTAGGVDSLVVSQAQALFRDGTVALPGISFISDTNFGFYRVAADVLGLSNAGVLSHEWRAGSYRTVDGTVSAPVVSFLSDTNTGIYRSTTDTLNIAANGTNVAQFSTAQAQLRDGTALLPGVSFISDPDLGIYRVTTDTLGISNVGVLSHEYRSTGYRTVDGTVGAPAVSFLADTNTGFYRSTPDTLNVSAGGANSLQISSAQALFRDGTVLLPGISFISDTNFGFYRVTADVLGLSNAGVLSHEWRAGSYRTVNGTVAAPAISFLGDTNTGFYWVSADLLGVAAAGAIALSIGSLGIASYSTALTTGYAHDWRGTATALGGQRFARFAATSGNPKGYDFVAAAHTGLYGGVNHVGWSYTGAVVTRGPAALEVHEEVVIVAPTIAHTAESAAQEAASFVIRGAPAAGALTTIAKPYSIWAQGGDARFDGLVRFANPRGDKAPIFLHAGT